MDWFVLGIEPTKDKKAITDAYRRKLRQTNPEDKPEEFKALRAAYEQALALADREEQEEIRDESPVGLWMESVRALYGNFAERIDPEKWVQVLRSDVCVALDTRPAAQDALLQFLMENYCLPRSVWTVLDEAFQFQERVEELYEAYPRDFVDHVIINGIRLEPMLAYELFEPGVNGADCDAYRGLYFQAGRTEIGQVGPILEQMDALSERHPLGEALRYSIWMETGRQDEGREGLRKLAQAYPDNPQLALPWASLCLEEGSIQEAKSIAERILEQRPEHISAKSTLAQCLAKQGLYHEAKELNYELMHSCGGDPVLMDQFAQQMKVWNEELIAIRQAKLTECPDDTENAMELVWCYAQNDRMEEAMELAQRIDPDKADPFSYHNLMGKLCHNQHAFSDALEHMKTVEQLIRGMEPDGTAETEKRRKRLPETLQIQGNCLMQLQDMDGAREKFDQALEIAPEDPEVLTIMGKILFVTGDYPYAVEILERLNRVKPNAWHGEMMLALALYRLRRDREAFDAANRAMAIQGNDLSVYIMKMQILIRNGVWDEVHAILDFLEERGAPEDIATDYVKAQLVELEQNNPKQALALYRRIAQRVEEGEDLLWGSELYYRMAVLTENQLNMDVEADRKRLLELIDKGLEYNGQDGDCLAYKAQLLKRGGKLREAIDMYRALEAKNPHSAVAQQGLAELYYEDLGLYAEEALGYYEKLLEKGKTPELCFYAATCKRYMGDLEGAGRYYRMELEMDPDDIDGYRGLACVCDAQGKYAESIALLDQAIAVMDSYGKEYMWLIEHKVQVLRRQGQYEQALECVDAAIKRYRYAAGFRLKFDICCQFGLWDRAKQVLDEWKRNGGKVSDLAEATGRLHLLTGKMFRAVAAMGAARLQLTSGQVQDFRLQLADLECNHARQIQIWSSRVKQNPGSDYAMVNLAQALWYGGREEAARQAAQKALELLDDTLSQNLTEEPLYRSRRCAVLAILGRAEEAKAELEKTRSLPLCQQCEYGSCKDADIYEATIEEILGNREKALQLYRAGRTNWPDDLDFAAGEARLKRKGKKQC